MKGTVHLMVGAASMMGAAPHVSPPELVLASAVSAASALLPDLDHPRSRASTLLGRRAHLLAHWAAGIAYRSTCTQADRREASRESWKDPLHRGVTHTLFFALVLGISFSLVAGTLVGVAVGTGVLSHIIADACTKAGVPLAWPLVVRGRRWHPFRLPGARRMKSGSPLEWIPGCGVALLCCLVPLALLG
jgi:membrane-bound metal-dependent hydrolase YbcI (DUF457 family)